VIVFVPAPEYGSPRADDKAPLNLDYRSAALPAFHQCWTSRAGTHILDQPPQPHRGHGDMARAKPSEPGSAARTFTAVIEPDEADGGYVVTFPAIPDLATQGETLAEAHLMAEDCLRGYLEVLRETGRQLPVRRRRANAPPSLSCSSRRHEPPAPDAQAPAGDPGGLQGVAETIAERSQNFPCCSTCGKVASKYMPTTLNRRDYDGGNPGRLHGAG
jgi:predicted RNase H-like HicB family nuclease